MRVDGRIIAIMPENSKALRIWYHQLYSIANESKEIVDFGLLYSTLNHHSPILMFKFKKQHYFETAAKYIPNVLVTFTADCKMHLWIENYAQVKGAAMSSL
jgi:hypothetical protein